MNRLVQRLAQRGSLSGRQEKALFTFAINLGRVKLARYRAQAGVGDTPILKMSKGQAWKLISEIMRGEGLTDG